jgi:hypothetical protein
MKLLLAKLNKSKFDTVFLWGFEKWLDSKLNKDDETMWNAVRSAANDHMSKR